MRVLVTGSRRWRDRSLVRDVLVCTQESFGDPAPLLVHGGDGRMGGDGVWVEGLDQLAGLEARLLGWEVKEFRADWDRWGSAAGPLRNQEMVDAGADVCIAFPLASSSGTWDCVRRADAARIPVVIVGSADVRAPRSWRDQLSSVARGGAAAGDSVT